MADRIEQQSTRLTSLVNQLLDASRIHAGKLSLSKERASLGKTVEDVVQALRPVYPTRKFVVSVQHPAVAKLDALRIEQVIANLLTNAVKFSPEHTPIEIAVRAAGHDAVQVSVRDYGAGVPPADRERCSSVPIKWRTARGAAAWGLACSSAAASWSSTAAR